MERKRNPGRLALVAPTLDYAEPVIGRRYAPTRWLQPGYERNHPLRCSPGKTLNRWVN